MTVNQDPTPTQFTLRPSAASRWLKCSGSALFAEIYPSKGSKYTSEGTAAHQLLEDCLVLDKVPLEFEGEVIEVEDETMDFSMGFTVDKEMIDAVAIAVERIRGHATKASKFKQGALAFAEFSELWHQHSEVPELQGTMDSLVVSGVKGYLDDLKYGRSAVQAQHRDGRKNPQLQCYASLAFDRFKDLEVIEAAIIQPRLTSGRLIKTVEFTREECETFMARVCEIAEELRDVATRQLSLPLATGSYCYFCPGRQVCPLLQREQAIKDFEG